MQSKATTPNDYLNELPSDRKAAVEKLRDTIVTNLPEGFKECMNYGMLGYVVPHSIYPSGYHCDPKTPLPFMALASQKNFIALYHMGLYGDQALTDWFVTEYPKHSSYKLDMGKGCVRFKKIEAIPYDLVAELTRKVSVQDWIATYEKALKR